MPDQESVTFDVDPRSVLAAIKQMNAAVEGFEKGSVGANERVQKAAERMADMMLKVNDRSRNSLERLTQSIEKQAAAYGKSGVDRLAAERDRIIKKLGDEQGMVERVTTAYAKMIKAESDGAGGAGQMGAAAHEAKASLALMGEEIGVHIPRHIRGFITMLPGVGQALDSAFKAVAVIALIAVIYEVIKKMIELHQAVEEMHTAAERAAGEFQRFTDEQKLANAELQLTNVKLENAIAKLEHKPENKLREAILEADVAAQSLAEKMDKAVRSFAELVTKNAPGMFAQIVGGRQDTKDIAEYLIGKSGFGGLSAELYKVTEAKGDPSQVLARGREHMNQRLRQAEFAQAYQQGKGFEGVSYEDVRRAMGGDTRGKLPAGLHLENMLADQSGVIDTVQAAIRQINLMDQSYKLQTQNAALRGKQGIAETAASTRELEQGFINRMNAVEMGPVEKILTELHEVIRKGANPDSVSGPAYAAANRELAKQQAEVDKQNRQMEMKAAEYAAKQWDEVYKTLDEGSKRVINDFKEAVKKAQDEARKRDEVQFQTIRSAAAHQVRIIGASAMPGQDELATLRAQLAVRTEAAKQEFAIKEAHSHLYDMDRERMVLQKEMQDAGLEYEEKVLEMRRRQFEETAKASASLWNTLLTKPGEFPKQLGSTIHSAILKPVTEGLGNMTAKVLDPIIHGSDGQGGIAGVFKSVFGGGKQDPIKAATDLNTNATMQNSAAVAALTAVLAGITGMGVPAIAAPTGVPGGISVPSISAPAVAGGGAGGFSLPAILGGGWDRSAGGGGAPLGGILGGGISPSSDPAWATYRAGVGTPPFVGGGSAGGGSTVGGITGLLKNFKSIKWGGFTRSAPTFGTDENGSDVQTSEGGKITGLNGVAGAAMFAGGLMAAQQGLLGSSRGTWGGIAMGTAGGAAIGFQQGGWLGAAIGGGVGFLAGLGEKIAGVESPENEAKRLVKQIYSINIDNSTAKQIAGIAQQKYAGHVSVAVRDPDVRKMLMLYSEATGQHMPLSATTPYGGSLAEMNSKLYQQAIYANGGQAYAYQSGLPVMGAPAGGANALPMPGQMTLQVNVQGQGAAQFVAGQVVTPEFVQAQWSNAGASSNGRLSNSAMMQQPGLVIS
ncbi:MAG: hypothetical protein LLG20_17195 [Acidobacteriales bacterium]|nr:hypothetical protein [Terriglobales bacterium]